MPSSLPGYGGGRAVGDKVENKAAVGKNPNAEGTDIYLAFERKQPFY